MAKALGGELASITTMTKDTFIFHHVALPIWGGSKPLVRGHNRGR